MPSGTAAERRAAHTQRGTARGERTRRRLLDAAYQVFDEKGYVDASVADIVKSAGVARGSFYTYFTSKLDIFGVVTGEVADTVDRALERTPVERDLPAVDALLHSNQRYVETFAANARVYALYHQLAHIDPELDARYSTRRKGHLARIERSIRRWQGAGTADATLDTEAVAAALLSMTSNLCHWVFVDKIADFGTDRVAAMVNEVWMRTLSLDPPSR